MDKVIFTPNSQQLSDHFGVPYRTLQRWKMADKKNWRAKMYAYLVMRYKKDMK